MREQIEGPSAWWNPPNNVERKRIPSGGGSVWIARLAIRVNGETELFSAMGDTRAEAVSKIESYLDQCCQCKHGNHLLCEIHGTENG